jgi:starvation-inducible DNA-binding protein
MDIDIGIKKADREAIADQLANVLADTYVLYFKTHGYHWNVTGPLFNTLHLMFETQYNELWTAVDAVAERIRALGIVAPGSGGDLAKRAHIKEADGVPVAEEMIAALAKGHERLAKTAREAFAVAERAGDQPTMDLLIERMQASEKTAWMLRAMLG